LSVNNQDFDSWRIRVRPGDKERHGGEQCQNKSDIGAARGELVLACIHLLESIALHS
jgi:hypothetical protein